MNIALDKKIMNILCNLLNALKYGLSKKCSFKLKIYTILYLVFWGFPLSFMIFIFPFVGNKESVEYPVAFNVFMEILLILFFIIPIIPIYLAWNKSTLESSNIDNKQLKPLGRVKTETFLETKPATSSILAPGTDINDNPNILVSITSSKGFKVGIWEKLDINILNVGEGMAKDIEIKLSGPLETSGNKIVKVLEGYGGQADIVIGVKPKEPGNIPLKVEVIFFDQKGKSYEMKEEAFISVAKESETISMQQTPVINIGSYVGEHIDRSTKIIDSMVQRSNIGAGARKCPNCGREVEANEKFCLECGAKL